MPVDCEVSGLCSGCAWIGRPLAEQHTDKLAELRRLWRRSGLPDPGGGWSRVAIRPTAESSVRDRVDMALRGGPGGVFLGFHDVTRHHVLDLKQCPQLTPALAAWLADLRRDLPPLRSASLRLRVSPDGTRGVWLDLSRAEQAALLAEGAWLDRAARRARVELGQRHQRVVAGARGIVLESPEPYPWFETCAGPDLAPRPLWMTIGGFSQPGFAANRVLVATVLETVDRTGAEHWLELGAGSGNLTLPLAGRGLSVTALELDGLALRGLALGLGADPRVTLRPGNFHRDGPDLRELLAAHPAVLADPPRSGLMGTLPALAGLDPRARPRHLVYVACHTPSLVGDALSLRALGYEIEAIEGADLFPQTPHAEWVASFRRH